MEGDERSYLTECVCVCACMCVFVYVCVCVFAIPTVQEKTTVAMVLREFCTSLTIA